MMPVKTLTWPRSRTTNWAKEHYQGSPGDAKKAGEKTLLPIEVCYKSNIELAKFVWVRIPYELR